MLRICSPFSSKEDKGFTLIELLVVIAILAILAVAVVLVLNPAELLKQGRDSTRLSDLAALNNSLGLLLTDVASPSFGSSSVVYVSLPAASPTDTNCASYSLPTLPSGWTYHCTASSTYTKVDGSGWVPVNLTGFSSGAPLGRLPVDPVNNASDYYMYTTANNEWKLEGPMESERYQVDAENDQGTSPSYYEIGSSLTLGNTFFPSGWTLVPGNSTFGTSDFYVMQYDAKCIQGTTPLTSPDNPGTPYHIYSNSSQPCTAPSYYIASTPDGYPITNINHNDAKAYCTSIGAHLLTNDEYMTIVTNAANQASNWSLGSVGSGVMPRGNSDANYAQSDTSPYGFQSGSYTTYRSDFIHLRTLTLSNGSVVWDMAGNVWEHVQRSVNNVGDLTTTMALPVCSNGTAGWTWCQFSNATTPYVTSWTSDVAQSKVAPPNSSWYSSQNIGQVYTYGTGANQNTTVFLRGGAWNNGSYAGPFTLHLGWSTTDAGSAVGFRCAR